MPALRFNHMELTLPQGALDPGGAREGIKAFYGEVLGFESLDVPILGQTGLLLRTDPETSQFILLTQTDAPLQSPGYDHLGFLYETREEVDAILEQCEKWQARDDRLQLKRYDDLDKLSQQRNTELTATAVAKSSAESKMLQAQSELANANHLAEATTLESRRLKAQQFELKSSLADAKSKQASLEEQISLLKEQLATTQMSTVEAEFIEKISKSTSASAGTEFMKASEDTTFTMLQYQPKEEKEVQEMECKYFIPLRTLTKFTEIHNSSKDPSTVGILFGCEEDFLSICMLPVHIG